MKPIQDCHLIKPKISPGGLQLNVHPHENYLERTGTENMLPIWPRARSKEFVKIRRRALRGNVSLVIVSHDQHFITGL